MTTEVMPPITLPEKLYKRLLITSKYLGYRVVQDYARDLLVMVAHEQEAKATGFEEPLI